jgi:alpha-galactosidase
MLAAPLMVNSDLRHIEPATLALLTNKDLIAIDQDRLGRQGHIVYKKDSIEVLAKELDKGEIAICVLNRSARPAGLTIDVPGQLGIRAAFGRIKDIFGATTTRYIGKIKCSLEAHDTRIYRLSL